MWSELKLCEEANKLLLWYFKVMGCVIFADQMVCEFSSIVIHGFRLDLAYLTVTFIRATKCEFLHEEQLKLKPCICFVNVGKVVVQKTHAVFVVCMTNLEDDKIVSLNCCIRVQEMRCYAPQYLKHIIRTYWVPANIYMSKPDTVSTAAEPKMDWGSWNRLFLHRSVWLFRHTQHTYVNQGIDTCTITGQLVSHVLYVSCHE